MKILITGTAGFIGFHLAKRLLESGCAVCGVDNLNPYYSVKLKEARNRELRQFPLYKFEKLDIADKLALQNAFGTYNPEIVVNFAAQAGVRHSLLHPEDYIHSNVIGFLNILECCRHTKLMPKLLYASSSSVYGGNVEMPFCESHVTDSPVSLYAATKKTDELMAHCYSHLYDLQTIGFRFFSVYGPWGRPDMASWLFASAMEEGRPIKVFNSGNLLRDFTYVDDIIDGVMGCLKNIEHLSVYEFFNVGNHRPERLRDMIDIIAHEMGCSNPQMIMLPMQTGDIQTSYASIDKIHKATGYTPKTPISIGLPRFCEWYKRWRAGEFEQ